MNRRLLRGIEEEALAALPGGTGPGALTARPRRRTGASRERRLQGPRHHDGDRGFLLSSATLPRSHHEVRTTNDADTIILGDGPLGWAIAAAAGERGERIPIIGRPAFDRHDRTAVLAAPTSSSTRRRDRPCEPTSRPGSRPASGGSSSRRPAGRPIASRSSAPWQTRARPRSSPPTSASGWPCSGGSSRPRPSCSGRSTGSTRSSSNGIAAPRRTGHRARRSTWPAG